MAKIQPINFQAVLLELKQKRLELDRAIAGIEALIALGPLAGFQAQSAINKHNEYLVQNMEAREASSFSNGVGSAIAGSQSGSFELATNLAKNRRASDRSHQAYAGMSILKASKELLAQHGRPMTAIELAQLLLQGGYHAESANFSNTVAAVLNRCDKAGGNVIRVGKNLFTLVTERKNSNKDVIDLSLANAAGNPPHLQQDQLGTKDSHE